MTDEDYFESLETRLDDVIELAERARERGADPTPEVEIPVAKDLADRVENLIGVEGVAERIRALEETEDSREDVALRLAEEFADGGFPPESRDDKAEAAIRTAVALLTEGVVAAPIEGIDGVDLLTNDDGSEYLKVEYAGPIRSAGGTAQALSVLIADYVGSSLGVDAYSPRDDEVERYVEEINLYANETGLQYTPKDKETRLVIENCPICLDGEPTTEREVSGYRDLERIDTNRGRGGMCLVTAEGIALKAPKIKKYVDALDMDGWDWIDELIHDTSDGDEEDDGEVEVKPNKKFLNDLTAGRPIFSHPSREGGFRLRYARARNCGLAASGVSPATMVLFDDFLAAGTQIKTERPGKAQGVAPVDGIEGPTVVLSNGEVRRIDDAEEARRVRNGVERILDVGEIAVPYGEFLENNHPLVPGSYTYDWWVQEVGETEADVSELREAFGLRELGARQAFRLARKYEAPLHPRFTYLWHDIGRDGYATLTEALEQRTDDELVFDGSAAPVLGSLLVPHVQDDEVRVEGDHAYVLGECLDADSVEFADNDSALLAAREAAGVEIRERAPTRIGARMGRPEKSEKREMNPAVHCLFPIGDAGGSQRDIDEAASHAETMRDTVGEIEVSAGGRRCPSCGNETYEAVCDCGERTEAVPRCPSCGIEVDEGVEECPRCGGGTTTVRRFDVRIDERYRDALDNVGERPSYDILKCVKGLMSERETPEPLEKGVLRAKHDVSTFKDGTVRYDMTDLPLTAFRPDEVGISVDRLREMGYEHDADGEPLTDGEQVVELKPQDVVLSRDSAEHLKRVADFVDDLLTEYYGVEPYHELDGTDDIVGELVMGLAPHTSAGVLGRVVGFTDASVGYAHPFFHAAKRRNCFAPDTKMPFIDEEGSLRHKTVESFVEKRLENTDEDGIRRDDFGTVVAGAEEVEVPSLDEDGEMKLKPVEAVSRHPAPEHLVKITTRDGRDIVVTPDHEMQIPDGSGGVTAERASEICRGDELMTPRHLDTVPDGGVSTVLSNGFERETDSDVEVDMVNSVEYVQSDTDYVYCLTVADTGSLVVNDLASKQCDGDEDCVTLMSDALVNFSREYLPDQRGGQMDAPLVMTSRIDPTEIDDEAHNVDKVSRYPLSFYEAAREYAHPKEVDVDIADDDLGTDAAFDGFGTTVETTRIDAGPENSAYKILPSMDEKTTAQLEIGRKTRAVDESDVAERVVESHFLPDLIGNLRAFTQQEFRCLDCNSKFRRPPLSGDCDCGGEVTLTVHKGSVKKYLDVALETGEKYGVSDYTMQRLEQLRRQIDSLFEDDKSTQSGIADFM
ncbi:DNA-directed DNA polymerase II large subunit [Haladaptatus sp. F3-133]|uniref:DNA polymerase II large subunit n=1 Tax=Halorutilus salinus TaxID=2487751 RepID=A0A9Q4C4T0_9EURY|nr:DNA-directed DNA polymerase II large subunit [Halorutilus salinus]